MDSNERAEKAAQVAFNALSMAQAYGILVESLIGVLKDSSILNPAKLDQLFRGAAAIIDQATPADRAQGMAQANMRQIIERAAKNAGIEIPPNSDAKKTLSMPATDEPRAALLQAIERKLL
jgi:hypothetical protein